MRYWPSVLRAVPLVMALAASGLAHPSVPTGEQSGDLRLEWTGAAGKIQGRAGEAVVLRFQLRNVGGRDAAAAVLAVATALGPLGPPRRLAPGPRAGQGETRTLSLSLARGMREVCIDAALETAHADEPRDPNPRDNRICRPVRVRADDDSQTGDLHGRP